MNRQDLRALMIALNDRPVVYHKAYRKITGSVTGAIYLGQLLYWWQSFGGSKFYKTDLDIIEETGLTPKELKNAKAAIKGLSFIRVTLEGIPAKTYYEIDAEGLALSLADTSKNEENRPDKIVPKGQTVEAERDQLCSPKGTDSIYEKKEKDEKERSSNGKKTTSQDSSSAKNRMRNQIVYQGKLNLQKTPPDVIDRILTEALDHGLKKKDASAFLERISGKDFTVRTISEISGLKEFVQMMNGCYTTI